MPERIRNTVTLTNEELQKLLEQAAKEGVRKLFADVGIDIDDEAVWKQFWKDLKEAGSIVRSFHVAKAFFWKGFLEKIGAGIAMFIMGILYYKYGMHK